MQARQLVLALGTFAIGTGAFVIAGILPILASDLQVDIATAGQLVTLYAIAYALCAPVLAVVTQGLSRRSVLVSGMALFALGNALAMLAPGVATLAVARALTAVAAALFTPAALAAAASLATPERRGKALALVTAGLTVANVIGVPLGTWIGSLYGWRPSFGMVALIAALAVAGLLFAVGSVPSAPASSLRQRVGLLADRAILGALGLTTLWMLGTFAVFTYVAPFLQVSAGLEGATLSVVLLVFGLAGVLGLWVGGLAADRLGSERSLTIFIPLTAVTLLLLPILATTLPGALVAVLLWGAVGWAAGPPQQSRLVHLAPRAPGVALAFYASALYLGVALGSAVGGLALSSLGTGALPLIGAAAEVMALGVLLASRQSGPRAIATEETRAAVTLGKS